jgi:hypothetical protein
LTTPDGKSTTFKVGEPPWDPITPPPDPAYPFDQTLH